MELLSVSRALGCRDARGRARAERNGHGCSRSGRSTIHAASHLRETDGQERMMYIETIAANHRLQYPL